MLSPPRPPRLHLGPARRATRILGRCPSLRAPYRPTPWAPGPHAQILLLLRSQARDAPLRYDEVEPLTTEDGGLLSLDWLGLEEPEAAPTLVVLPTICGSGQSLRGLVHRLRAQLGFRVVVCNRRGHAGLPLTTPRFDIVGSTADLRAQLARVEARLPASPLYGLGVSAGAALLLRHLGEEGAASPLRAAVALSAGHDVGRTLGEMHPAYDRALLRAVKRHFLAPNGAILRDAPGYEALAAARTMAELDERLAPLAGYPDAAARRLALDPAVVAARIAVPLLALQAEDDPVCVGRGLGANGGIFAGVPDAILAVTHRGSHCAFFEGSRRPSSWAERLIAEYLRGAHEIG